MSDPLKADIRAAANLPPIEDDFATEILPASGTGTPTNRLGKYILREQIGSGGMAYVFEATQGGSGMSVAVKSCRLGEDAAALQLRFRREIAIAAGLVHDNIVRLHDADHDNHRPFLVMERLVGSPLHLLLLRGPMRTADACEIARQIAAGLGFAHARGVVHRDVKPGNAFLTTAGVVKVLDWGLAKQEGQAELTHAFQGGGTPGFAAPEQLRDMRSVDARADLYALGVTLWALLLGKKPLEGEPLPVGLAANLEALLRRMTASVPSDRPATAQEVADALAPLTSGHDLPALVGRQATLNGELLVEWWDEVGQCRRTLYEPGALPMPTKTHLYLGARLSRPAYVYLVWIDTQGKLYPIHGWRKGSNFLPDESLLPKDDVTLSGTRKTIPLEGTAGTETVVLLARERPLTEDEPPLFGAEHVEPFKEKLSRMPRDPRQCYVFPAAGLRGPGTAEPISDPIELLHDALRGLCGRFDLVRAMSFANRGY